MGTIEKGKLADLVLLDANPLDDIRNTQKIAAVIVNGRYFSRADLDKMLAGVEAAAQGRGEHRLGCPESEHVFEIIRVGASRSKRATITLCQGRGVTGSYVSLSA